MSKHNEDSIDWFKEKYPMENFLSEEIGRQVNEIFKRLHPSNEIHQIPLDMYRLSEERRWNNGSCC